MTDRQNAAFPPHHKGEFDDLTFCNPTQLNITTYGSNARLLHKLPVNTVPEPGSLTYENSTLHVYTSQKLRFGDNDDVYIDIIILVVDVCCNNNSPPTGLTYLRDDDLIASVQENLNRIGSDCEHEYWYGCNGGKCRENFHNSDRWCTSCNSDFDARQLREFVLCDTISFSDINPNSIVFAEVETHPPIDWSNRGDLNSLLDLVTPVLENIRDMYDLINEMSTKINEANNASAVTLADEEILNSLVQNTDPTNAALVDLLKRRLPMTDGRFVLDPGISQRLLTLQNERQTTLCNLKAYLKKYPEEKYGSLFDFITKKIAEIDAHEERQAIEQKEIARKEAELNQRAAEIAVQLAQLNKQKVGLSKK